MDVNWKESRKGFGLNVSRVDVDRKESEGVRIERQSSGRRLERKSKGVRIKHQLSGHRLERKSSGERIQRQLNRCGGGGGGEREGERGRKKGVAGEEKRAGHTGKPTDRQTDKQTGKGHKTSAPTTFAVVVLQNRRVVRGLGKVK